MNAISQILQKKRQASSCALIPFVTAGYPSIEITIDILSILDKKGADAIELGIPYSDALADGDLIQNASKIALQNGVYVNQVIQILNAIYHIVTTPIIIFTYYNPILVYGLPSFIKKISEMGAKGLIIPDLPIEESDYILSLCSSYSLELIFFISPTSSKTRIINILSKAPGCIYLVSSTGVTGIRDLISNNISSVSNYISFRTEKLVMLGFGISSPSQVSKLVNSDISINGIVVGSAFTRIICDMHSSESASIVEKVGRFCEEMKLSVTT